jgi:acid phosphatase type 7
VRRLGLIAFLALLLGGSGPGTKAHPVASVLLAAGDIASCDSKGDEITAALIAGRRGTVAALGDNVYPSGTVTEFRRCYEPSWGSFRNRTRPAAGNHEYATAGAAGYFGYFGRAAGARGRGFYSYGLGAWHVIVLNSNCGAVNGCDPASPQGRWLARDLRRHHPRCTLAYWHHPLFSSGFHGGASAVRPLWRLLYRSGVDVVLNGHDHDYERFAPQTPDGRHDARRGMRQFVVGTGGRSLYPFVAPLRSSVVRHAGAYGVLELKLRPRGYEWRFIAEPGKRFADAGSAACH